jgi:hypothetical protein
VGFTDLGRIPPAPFRIVERYRRSIEGLRVEFSTSPCEQLLVLFVVGIGNGRQELRIAVNASRPVLFGKRIDL